MNDPIVLSSDEDIAPSSDEDIKYIKTEQEIEFIKWVAGSSEERNSQSNATIPSAPRSKRRIPSNPGPHSPNQATPSLKRRKGVDKSRTSESISPTHSDYENIHGGFQDVYSLQPHSSLLSARTRDASVDLDPEAHSLKGKSNSKLPFKVPSNPLLDPLPPPTVEPSASDEVWHWEKIPAIRELIEYSACVDKKHRHKHSIADIITNRDSMSARISFWEKQPLRLLRKFGDTSGALNAISQAGCHLATCHSTLGGDGHSDDPYNRNGTLNFWDGSNTTKADLQIVESHFELRSTSEQQHFTVNDVQFFPNNPNRMVSTGYDCAVQVCEREEECMVPVSKHQMKEKSVPHGIEFKPGSSIFAVGNLDGSVYMYTDDIQQPPVSWPVDPKSHVCCVTWGHSQSEGYIFVGAESPDPSGIYGAVKYVCLGQGGWDSSPILSFPRETYSCETLALDVLGQRLAIISSGYAEQSGRYLLRMYDPRCSADTHIYEQTLPKFSPKHTHHNVISAAFSPDNIYLACARSDNRIVIYDSRFLHKGEHYELPLHVFRHQNCISGEEAQFGITAMSWVSHYGSSSPPLLISGGNDGAVRIWDVRESDEQKGTVLAQLDSSVGGIHIGDISKNEWPLVAGDNDGKVYIYLKEGTFD